MPVPSTTDVQIPFAGPIDGLGDKDDLEGYIDLLGACER
jgi:hypothetical protein